MSAANERTILCPFDDPRADAKNAPLAVTAIDCRGPATLEARRPRPRDASASPVASTVQGTVREAAVGPRHHDFGPHRRLTNGIQNQFMPCGSDWLTEPGSRL